MRRVTKVSSRSRFGPARRTKLRKLVLAKLISERGEDDDQDEFDTDEEESERIGPAGKAAMFGAAKRRQRVRRAGMAKALADHDE